MLLPDSEFGGSQAASTFAAVDTLDSLRGPSGKWWSWTGLVVLSSFQPVQCLQANGLEKETR